MSTSKQFACIAQQHQTSIGVGGPAYNCDFKLAQPIETIPPNDVTLPPFCSFHVHSYMRTCTSLAHVSSVQLCILLNEEYVLLTTHNYIYSMTSLGLCCTDILERVLIQRQSNCTYMIVVCIYIQP